MTDKTNKETQSSLEEPSQKAENSVSRRRFTRAGVGGAAVLLTLANRSAWSNTLPGQCVSESNWSSWQAGAASSISHHEDEVQAFNNFTFSAGDTDPLSGLTYQGEDTQEVIVTADSPPQRCWTINRTSDPG